MPSGLIRDTVLRFDAAVQQTKQAAVEFVMHWQSADASHAERLYFEKINFWRDFPPGTLGERLAGLPAGGAASQSFAPGELLPAHDSAAVLAVRAEQVDIRMRNGTTLVPRAGRFYPRGLFSGLPDVFAGDLRPLRYLGVTNGMVRVDLNHPLARCPLRIEGHIVQTLGLSGEYFRAGGFTGLGTETARNWPRPPDDPHAGQFAFADPLFAAWGRAG